LIPREKPDCRAAGLEERNSLAGGAKFSRETKRFVKAILTRMLLTPSVIMVSRATAAGIS